ncbi:hypothetical protein MMC25_003940 [Agyrium rufum]|nr:hypothetical protein [Agyrium rufum]
MELSRQEYPALLSSLQPSEAVSVLQERVATIGKVNVEIADWLAERRKIEEAYVHGLRRLVSRGKLDGSSELGIFRTPWTSIVNSTESLAASHGVLANRLAADIEQPLRDYQTKNREMQSMNTIQGNLISMAKEVDNAHRKTEKAQSKSGGAGNKATQASAELDGAQQQWQSQAPFVFEQLQALDESRVNHLRDVLTQFQTHEVDLVERNRVTAESCLNAILNVNTSDEISTFVARVTGRRPDVASRRLERAASIPPTPDAQSTAAPALSQLRPPTSQTFSSTPSRSTDEPRRSNIDRSAVTSMMPPPQPKFAPETTTPKKSGFGGLKRLGTVMSRRKTETSMDNPTPEKEKKSKSRNPLRRGTSSKHMQQIPSPDASTAELPSTAGTRPATSREVTTDEVPQLPPVPTDERLGQQSNGSALRRASTDLYASSLTDIPMTNGNVPQENGVPKAELQAPAPTPAVENRDPEGFSAPPPQTDDISRAMQEAAEGENAPHLKLDIRNEPIHEEDGDVQTALTSVADRLRSQQAQMPQRKLGAPRGRRDVRNTIFVPSPQMPEGQAQASPDPPSASLPPISPFDISRLGQLSNEHRGSDAQSIKSAHSVGSVTSNPVRHPQMHEPGLNASIVETVSAWFSGGNVTKAVVIGEVALAHNPPPSDDASSPSSSSESETIRLENFPVLEKVAPNPMFITQVPSKSGEYSVNTSHVSHQAAVAFKYQVHLDEENLAIYAPMTLTANWKIESRQASVIVSYAFNPAFTMASSLGVDKSKVVSLQNVYIALSIENTRASSCLSKPVGSFSKEKNLIYWKLGDVSLSSPDNGGQPQKLLARFATDGEAKPGSAEAKWEISGEAAVGLGSGLSVSQVMDGGPKEAATDPFADESVVPPTSASAYKEVASVKKLLSGKYVA